MWAKLASLLGRLPRGWRALIETCVVGLAAGLAAVGFQAGIDGLGKLIYTEAHWGSRWALAVDRWVSMWNCVAHRFPVEPACPEPLAAVSRS